MRLANTKRALLGLSAATVLAAGGARAAPPAFVHAATILQDEQQAPLRFPEGVACTSDGTVVVADSGNGRLVRFAYRDGQVSGGTPVVLKEVPYPTRLQIDGKGNILVLDRKARRIARLDPTGTFVAYVDVKAPSGASALVGSFKLDGSDNLFAQDLASNKVLVLSPAGAATRQLDLPAGAVTDIAVDAAGKIYALDAASASVWIADRGATAFKPLATGMREYLSFPAYVTVTGGRLLVMDQNGHGMVMLGLDGSYQGRQLGLGWSNGFLYYPAQICLSEKGFAVVADRSNNRVQIFKTGK